MLPSNYQANPIFNIQETYPRFSLNTLMYKTEDDLNIAVKESLDNEYILTQKDHVEHLGHSSLALLTYLQAK
jgi:hypothetical protein